MTDTIDAPAGAISAMRLPELQALASQLGVKGTSKMRKSDLVDAISASRAEGGRTSSSAAKDAAAPARTARTARRASSEGEKAAEPTAAAPKGDAPQADARQESAETARVPRRGADDAAQAREEAARKQAEARLAEKNRRQRDAQGDQDASSPAREARDAVAADLASIERGLERAPRSRRAGRDAGAPQGEAAAAPSQDKPTQGAQGDDRRSRNDKQRQAAQGQPQQAPAGAERRQDEDDERGGRRRRGRDRYRDRDRGGKRSRSRSGADLSFEEIELGDDDVLLPVAGILDIRDNYALVRTSGYLPGPSDVYVSMGQVKKHGLRRGDAVMGAVRQPRDGEQPPAGNGPRSKYNSLARLDSVNGMEPSAALERPEFSKLTPLYPQERLRLENVGATKLTPRVIDIVAPIGKGQRGLIVAPPKAGKTIIMQQIANSITANNPEVHLMVVLVDERPEEVTDMERTVQGEVIASTFDRPASDHTIVAELAIERAKRLVELGQDVVVLLDSLTRLSRAYNLAAPASGRILSGGVDASALYPPKRFFGAARNIENGGSLTILASALVETGSKMDEVIFEEFKGTGNMELRLSRNLADKRIFPAVDVNASGTRREEILMGADELRITWKLRRVLAGLDQQQAIELLLGKFKETKSNVEFLLQVQKTTPTGPHDEEAGTTV